MGIKIINKRIKLGAILVIAYLSLPLLLLNTNPSELPLPLLILPIVLIFSICFITALVILKTFRSGMRPAKKRMISVVSAVLPTLLAVLQSIQQLDAKDVLIVLGLWLLLIWYLQRVDFF